MELDVSPKMKRTARAAHLTVEQMVFADLIAAGWSPEDAFIAAFRKGSTWMKTAFNTEVEKQKNNEYVIERIEKVSGALSSTKIEAAKAVKKDDRSAIIDAAMSKENMLYNLQTALQGQTVGSKEWIDINKMIIDVTRMKQDEVKTDDTTVHCFLPALYPTSCRDCLYSRCDSCKYKKAYNDG